MINTALISIVLAASALVALPPAIQIDRSTGEESVCPRAQYLEDSEGNFSVGDVAGDKYADRWIRSERKNLGFGFSESVYWIRFIIENREETDLDLYLEESFPHIDSINVYIPGRGGFRVVETGNIKPFGNRPVDRRNFAFPLTIKAKTAMTLYIRYQSTNSINVDLTIWSPEKFRRHASNEDRILMIFYGTILVMGLYNLIVYLFIRRVVFLAYVFCVLFYLLFMISMDGIAFQLLWPNSPRWANMSLSVLLDLAMIFIIVFSEELVELRTVRREQPYRKIIYYLVTISIIAGVLLTIATPFIPNPMAIKISTLYAVYSVSLVLSGTVVLVIKERYRSSILSLAATSAIIVGGIAHFLVTFGIVSPNFYTSWSLHIGSAVMGTLFSCILADSMNIMGKEIQVAEKKYRGLVESSNDIVFSLDENLNFLSVNKAITRHLGFTEADIVGKNFFDFLYEKGGDKNLISKITLSAYLNELIKTGKSVTFRAGFKPRYIHELKEMSIKLERAEAETGREKIIGKASLVDYDIIMKYLETERHTYRVENYLYNAELLSQRLVRNLNRYLEAQDVIALRIALREILVNAIEHGNLDIKFDEKTQAIDTGNYLEIIQERQNDPRFIDRRILIDYALTEEGVTYVISDQGDGFDHATMVRAYADAAETYLLSHGRGLLLAMETFDEVSFNEVGNQVSLVKNFKKNI
jgi:two-component system, sensor histidine kinase LadS